MKKLKKNLVVIILVLVLVIILIPLLYLFNFAVMNADDFIYGDAGREVWLSTHSFGKVVVNAFVFAREYYDIWQGSYFSVFMMTMQPGIFSTSVYRVVLLLMFLLCMITPIFALLTFNKFYLKAKIRYILPYSLLYLFMVTQYMPSSFEAYYWYNSAVYYQFTFCMIMLYIGICMYLNNSEKTWVKTALTTLLAILAITISGSNYVTGLVFVMLYGFYVLISLIKKSKNRFTHLALFYIYFYTVLY